MANEEVTLLPDAAALHASAAIHCPVCGTAIDEEPVLCPRCETPHHQDCWAYSGGCAIFGCDKRGWLTTADGETRSTMAKKVGAWIWFHRLDGWFKAVGTLGATTLFTAIPVSLIVGSLLRHFLGSSTAWLGSLLSGSVLIGMLAVYLALFLLFLIGLPRWIVGRRLEKALGAPLLRPTRGDRSDTLLERLDPPAFDKFILDAFERPLPLFTFLAILGGLCPPLAGFVSGRDVPLVWFVGICFILIRVVLLPTVIREYRKRITEGMSLQNRLLASFKGKKKG